MCAYALCLKSKRKKGFWEVKKISLWPGQQNFIDQVVLDSQFQKNTNKNLKQTILDLADNPILQNNSIFSDNRCLPDKSIFTRDLWMMFNNLYKSYNKLQLLINKFTRFLTLIMGGCLSSTI